MTKKGGNLEASTAVATAIKMGCHVVVHGEKKVDGAQVNVALDAYQTRRAVRSCKCERPVKT